MDLFSPDILKKIMPNVPDQRLAEGFDYLLAAMVEAEIGSVRRVAAFLAQLAHESGELRYFQEIADGSQYEGRANLGNVNPGDGKRFKGRGPIQLTGRANYVKASAALGLDLVNNPETAATPQVGYRIAAWYWTSHNLNALADQFDFDGVTRAINGGLNGRAQRIDYYLRALSVLTRASALVGISI